MIHNQKSRPSILIIGITRGTGNACLHALAAHPSQPHIHAFCRDPKRLSKEDQALCSSVYQGDARRPSDIERALHATGASVVILSTGTGESVAPSDIRTVSGQALSLVLQRPAFRRIRAIVVSSVGASNSQINVGLGMGTFFTVYLRNVLKDHTGQEKAFRRIQCRTTIARATHLTDHKPVGSLISFRRSDHLPTFNTDRQDLAAWIADEALHNRPGRVVNLTGDIY